MLPSTTVRMRKSQRAILRQIEGSPARIFAAAACAAAASELDGWAGVALIWGCVWPVLLYTFGGLLLIGALGASANDLSTAAKAGDVDSVRAQLAKGASPHAGEVFCGLPFVGRLLRADAPIYLAASQGHTEVVRALLACGAQPDGGTSVGLLGSIVFIPALCSAADAGHLEVVRSLLDAGVDVDARVLWGPLGCISTCSAINAASAAGHKDVVEMLLGYGATGSGRHGTVAKSFWRSSPAAGASVGPFALFGAETALDAAERKDQAEIVSLLQSADTDKHKTS